MAALCSVSPPIFPTSLSLLYIYKKNIYILIRNKRQQPKKKYFNETFFHRITPPTFLASARCWTCFFPQPISSFTFPFDNKMKHSSRIKPSLLALYLSLLTHLKKNEIFHENFVWEELIRSFDMPLPPTFQLPPNPPHLLLSIP